MSFNFGGTSTSLGQPQAPAVASSSGFSLAPNVAAVRPQGSFNFGGGAATSATSSATTGFSLGTAATQASGTPAFGSLTSTGFGGGTTSTSSSGLNFGAPAPGTPSLGGFGAGNTTAAPTLNFGGTSTTQSTINFGAPAASSATPNFGAPPASVATLGGLGQPSNTLSLGGSSTTASAATAPTPAFQGLGGSNKVLPQIGNLTSSTNTSSGQQGQLQSEANAKSSKDSVMPAELNQTVEELKKFVKDEKNVSSEIAHVSSREQQKIEEHIAALAKLLQTVTSGLTKNKAQLDKLKMDAAEELMNAEIAQHTRDIPPAMQYENVAPADYFARLVKNFENQMLYYRRQIEETEQHLQTMADSHVLCPGDISRAISKLHSIFTNLAARYQKVHESIQHQKELFIHRNRQKLGSGAAENLFSKPGSQHKQMIESVRSKIPVSYVGPSPFSTQDVLTLARASTYSSSSTNQSSGGLRPTFQSNNQLWPSGQAITTASPFTIQGQNPSLQISNTTSTPGILGNTLSPFGNTDQSSTFQISGKRGKH